MSTAAAIVARATDDNNYLMIYSTGSVLVLYKRVAGAFTELTRYTGTISSGDVLKFVVDSNNLLTGYINNVSRVSATDSFNSTATKHGLQFSSDAISRFTAFTIVGAANAVDMPSSITYYEDTLEEYEAPDLAGDVSPTDWYADAQAPGDDLPQQGITEDGQYFDPEDEPFDSVDQPLAANAVDMPSSITYYADTTDEPEWEDEAAFGVFSFNVSPPPDLQEPDRVVFDLYNYDDQDEPFEFVDSTPAASVPDQIWAEDGSTQLEDEDHSLLLFGSAEPLSASAVPSLARERTKMGVGT